MESTKESSPPVRVLIANDYRLFRDTLKKVLETDPSVLVLGEVSSQEETLKQVRLLNPDILLFDWDMAKKSGEDILQLVSISGKKTKIILLISEVDQEQVSELLQKGVRGLVPKESSSNVLFKSIQCVMGGEYWIVNESFANSIEALNRPAISSSREKRVNNYGLTPRELEIIASILSGYTNRQIAKVFSISEQTVKHHVTNIFDKLGIYNRLELTLFALNHNLIDKPK